MGKVQGGGTPLCVSSKFCRLDSVGAINICGSLPWLFRKLYLLLLCCAQRFFVLIYRVSALRLLSLNNAKLNSDHVFTFLALSETAYLYACTFSDCSLEARYNELLRRIHHYQAAWMDHWKHITRKQFTEVHNHLLHGHEQERDDHHGNNRRPLLSGPETATSTMKQAQGFREFFDARTMKLGKEIIETQPLPMLNKQLVKSPQTTYQFFDTKKTGDILTEGGQVLGGAIVSLKEFLSLSPSFSLHGKQGVKLQSLEKSSTDSEGNDSSADVIPSTVCLKNESSVETDAMELDVFQKIHLSSLALCPSEKNDKGVHNSSLFETWNATGEEAVVKMANTGLPDMNEDLPVLSDAENPTNKVGISTSRTQSLDVEHLLCYTQQPSVATDVLGQEPSSRCAKRLKLNTPDHFVHVTKSSKLGEVSSYRKVMDCSKTSSGHTVDRSHVTPEPALDQTATLFKNGNSSSDSVRKNQETSVAVARSWIQRWSRQRNAYPNKEPGALVLCEPQSSKATLDELHQKKQFPSIAAMALMGKAMNGFHPCEFKKTGSLIVWST